MATHEALPIGKAELDPHKGLANSYLQTVTWKPQVKAAPVVPAGTPVFREASFGTATPEKLSLIQVVRAVSGDDILFSETGNRVLTTLRRGLQIAAHVSDLYVKASGLEALIAANTKGKLGDVQLAEFRSKCHTASAVALFILGYYMSWEFSKDASTSGVTREFPGIPEMHLQAPREAMHCALFYYGAGIAHSGEIRTDAELSAYTLSYWKSVLAELKLRESALSYDEPFTERSYKLAESEFAITGWDTELNGAHTSVEFNRVELDVIVGNRDAKHFARRNAQRLMAYSITEKRNPLFDLGGMSLVAMGFGIPGTGKSMIISATATMIQDYCTWLGIPFLFWPMPDTIISTFQGGSGERMMQWMTPIRDSSRIIYAPIDDAENNLEERTRHGVSAGVREVIGVFLRNTEGAYAVRRGNAMIELYTNLPEQIDKAVRSRIIRRTSIDGATILHDFIDQDYLWWKKWKALDSDFVNQRDPDGYEYLSAQRLVRTLSETGACITEPREASIREAFEAVLSRCNPTEHIFLAEMFSEVKKIYPSFSSRDVRNIQSAVDSRIMDFDFPDEWMEDPEIFFRQPYDTKTNMVKELIRATMKGLSFADIRLEEAIRYLDSMVRITDAAKVRAIEQRAEEIRTYRAAEKIVASET